MTQRLKGSTAKSDQSDRKEAGEQSSTDNEFSESGSGWTVLKSGDGLCDGVTVQCVHCRENGGEVQETCVDGEWVPLHPKCQQPWQAAQEARQ